MEDTDVLAGNDATVEQSEKMVPQSHVEAIVKREKAKVAERLAQEFEQRQGQQPQAAAPQIDQGALEQRIMEQLAKRRQQELEDQQRQEHENLMAKMAQQYHLKMGKGKEAFEDFDEIMADFDPSAFPATSFLAAELDITPHIMYELNKNPSKLVDLETLAQKSPIMARKQMKLLADSIQANTAAQEQHKPTNPPLSRLKSSPGAGAAGGKPNFKGASWLKG